MAVVARLDRGRHVMCAGVVVLAAVLNGTWVASAAQAQSRQAGSRDSSATADGARRQKPMTNRTDRDSEVRIDETNDDPDHNDLADARQGADMKTLGGRQFWGDVSLFHGYRIQRNVFTGHCRLLDAEDRRQTWGTLEQCRKRLDEIRVERKLPAMKGRAVVVIHGIVRSSKSFAPMTDALRKEGWQVFGFDYPSTQVTIPEAAEFLHSCLESLTGIEEINLVVHSMGGLVVRAYLDKHADKRLHRLVMLGVPNKGAEMADFLRRNLLFRAIYGPAGQQLVTDANGLISRLPTPNFEFAVIAGARGDERGFNPLIPGDDDGTVRLESAKLEGACDFATVKCLHSFLMRDPGVAAMTVRFLKDGCLREDGERQPILKPENAAAPGQKRM